jgi:phosphomannomutase
MFTADVLERIRSRKIKAVVDAVHCSGSVIVPALLRTFGAEVVELYCDASGIFPHTPEPLPENLTELGKAVREHNADIGISVDPDADRLVLIGSDGNAIGEEKTIMLAIEAVMRNIELFPQYARQTVVNLSTSRMAIDATERHGGTCTLAPVGEINVVRAMQQCNAVIGGEGSGGVILPACHYGRDSLVGIALVLWLLGTTDTEEWSALAGTTPYTMIKYKQEVSSNVKQLFPTVAEHFPHARINTQDGIRADLPDSWVQVRASNTEPIIRIISEAPTRTQAEELLQTVARIFA